MNFDHQALLSGQKKGPVATSARLGLHFASWLYGGAARFRRYQYDHHRKPIHQAGVPVISVGNLTTGGTGKTPIVCDLCSQLRQLGAQVAIVSRGYGAGESGVNDEAMELAARLPDVPHVQHPDRVEAARIAVEELEAEVLVMDDGFQHRRLHRDLDIVVIDATCPFGFGYQLPRGYLREPISSLRRADLIVVSRSDQVQPTQRQHLKEALHIHAPNIPVINTVHRPSSVQYAQAPAEPISSLSQRKIALISAIGNPDAFERSVQDCNGQLIAHRKLPDHDAFDRETRQELRTWVDSLKQSTSVDLLLCTHKDAVKLATDQIAGVPLGFLQIELAYEDTASGETILAMLQTTLSAN
ncbi:lipid-A-disaccharide kinase [Neorhodopirellula lusitana]|uniref:Tetraacyldisaccharide 4'-kinase n=1 Tax=Neorhodopirellula lusitana TaxID=445327 RepID=A0ABY1PX57_9BACT|nr:tetraacyldisaccharide 4'-kinase [Neorhodopirellula lusitana]SMP49968.1 lipid-A-disaccharide kinase [Neorhodopirellula lusitana]